MPSPVTPSQFCAAIPAANADLCTRLQRFFNVVSLLCDFFSWFLSSGGDMWKRLKACFAVLLLL